MSFDVTLRKHLIGYELSVKDRIYPEIVPVNPIYPLIVINQPAALPVQHRDIGVLRRVTKIIRSYSETSAGAWSVATELRGAIMRFPGWITNESSAYETESKRYLVVTVATFWSRE